MARPGVVGVAEGRTLDGRPCVVVLVEAGADVDLPTELDGHPVDVRTAGPVTAL